MVSDTEITAAEAFADAVADAIGRYAVAYSHTTLTDMSTVDRAWKVHETGHGNPFDRGVWLGEFDNKAEAKSFAVQLRRSDAVAAAKKAIIQARNAALEEAIKAAEEALLWDLGDPAHIVATAIRTLTTTTTKQGPTS